MTTVRGTVAAMALACLILATGLNAPTRARAYHEEGSEWVFGTAYTLKSGELSLGLIRWEAGVLDELMVGANLLPWVVGPFFGTVVPTGYVKVRDWLHGPLAVSLEGQFLYVDATAILERYAEGASSKLLSMMATAATSWRASEDLSASLQLTYTIVSTAGDSQGLAFEGSAVLDSLQAAPLLEWRFDEVFALHLQGRLLLYREAPNLQLRYRPDERTTVDANLSANFAPPIGAWNIVPALAIAGEHVHFKIGAGYGHRWLPVLGLVFNPGLVVDLDFFVRF